jgi:predicted ester cyclase
MKTMKLLIVSVMVICSLFIYGSQDAQKSEVERNKEIVHYFLEEAWNRCDHSKFSEIIAGDATWHLGGKSYPWSPEIEKAILLDWWKSFPDHKYVVEDIFGEGDKVVARMVFTGTHQGMQFKIPPTGKPIKVTEIQIFRFANGKMVENWTEFDKYGLFRQLGALEK